MVALCGSGWARRPIVRRRWSGPAVSPEVGQRALLPRVPAFPLVAGSARRACAGFFRRRPAGEQAECLRGPRAGLGGVSADDEAGFGADLEPVEAELELAHDLVDEPLDALGV